MRELDYILGGFVETDYSILCLMQVMAALEEYYNVKDDKEQKNTIFTIEQILKSIEHDLEENIERLDRHILNHK